MHLSVMCPQRVIELIGALQSNSVVRSDGNLSVGRPGAGTVDWPTGGRQRSITRESGMPNPDDAKHVYQEEEHMSDIVYEVIELVGRAIVRGMRRPSCRVARQAELVFKYEPGKP